MEGQKELNPLDLEIESASDGDGELEETLDSSSGSDSDRPLAEVRYLLFIQDSEKI